MQHSVLSDRPHVQTGFAGAPGPEGDALDGPHRLRAEILSHGSIPGAPAILAEILALLDEERDIQDVAEVIELEPGLTAKLLRTANSPFFGQSRNVTSIQRAIVVLGTSLVRNVSIGFAVWDTISGGLPSEQVEALWSHAVTVAIAARHMAIAIRSCDPDEAFTAGLLHDCGQLVLARARGEVYRDVRERVASGASAHLAERAAIGVDHAAVGSWLLEAWNLPAPLVAAVREHHSAEPGPGLPALIAVTSALARIEEIEEDRLDGREHATRAAAANCGISADLWADAASAVLTEDTLRHLARA